MVLSILHSKRRVPWLALKLVLVALIAWLLGGLYTYRLDPELRFFKCAARIKQQHARNLTKTYGHKTLIYGGASWMFLIDTEKNESKTWISMGHKELIAE